MVPLRAWERICLACPMVEGFVGPCMLGAMGIIFVAFLAPSGCHYFLPYARCGADKRLHDLMLRDVATGTFVVANYQNEQSDKERSGQYGGGKRDA